MVFAFKIIGEDTNHQNKKYKKIAFKISFFFFPISLLFSCLVVGINIYIYPVRQVDGDKLMLIDLHLKGLGI